MHAYFIFNNAIYVYMYKCMYITNTKGTYLQGEPSSAWLWEQS